MGNHDNSPDQLIPVALDVTDTARDSAVVDETVERHGRLDVLVNGAGRTQVGALEETTEAEMRYLFDLHYFGPAALDQKAAAPTSPPGGGRGGAGVCVCRAARA